MNMVLSRSIDRAEWMRYLHITDEPDEQLMAQMEEAETLLLEAARPRWIYRLMDREHAETEGVSIEKHLEDCSKVAALAVTIGSQIDELIRRTQLTSMPMALLLDTGASVLAEQAADTAEQMMKEELSQRLPDMYATSRFSPGYGDFPLRFQEEILAWTDAGRKIGLALTSGSMLTPHKSVTALVGLSEHPVTGRLASCEECVLRSECEYLKEGRKCYAPAFA